MSPPFPAARSDQPASVAAPAGSSYRLRPLGDDDLPWLRELYAQSREDELAPIPWPTETKRAFLDQQFAAQHVHYVQHYADADFLAIERDGRPIGRLYLARDTPDHLIVDICLFAQARGSGIGSALIRGVQADAAALGRGVRLHVHATNAAARRLYERLGFTADGTGDGLHLPMRWRAPAATQLKTAS